MTIRTKIRTILNYKQDRRNALRNEMMKYGHTASAMYGVGLTAIGNQYLKVAGSYADELFRLDTSKLSSIQTWKRDQEQKRRFESLYPDSVELFS